jgi:hypothetical protein
MNHNPIRKRILEAAAAYLASDQHPLLNLINDQGKDARAELRKLGAWERPAETAYRVLLRTYEHSETWAEDEVGSCLAYLAMSILNPDADKLFYVVSETDLKFYTWMRTLFPIHDPVWGWVAEVGPEDDADGYILSCLSEGSV